MLQTGIEFEPNFVDEIVKCMCLLHNIIIDEEGELQPVSLPQRSGTSTAFTQITLASLGENMKVSTADVIRDKFRTCFCEHDTNT